MHSTLGPLSLAIKGSIGFASGDYRFCGLVIDCFPSWVVVMLHYRQSSGDYGVYDLHGH